MLFEPYVRFHILLSSGNSGRLLGNSCSLGLWCLSVNLDFFTPVGFGVGISF